MSPLANTSKGSHAEGDARLAQQSVTPWFRRRARNTTSRREAAVQDADGPDLLRFTGAVTCGCGETVVVLAVASMLSAEPEILQCISGVQGRIATRWQVHIMGHQGRCKDSVRIELAISRMAYLSGLFSGRVLRDGTAVAGV
jgi:hypothetical protein